MKNIKQFIVIPARMSGTRLPGKPLIKILGKEIILRVWEKCVLVHPKKYIYIITEDEIIEKFCNANGINCYNTGIAESAIDRVKLFSDKFKAHAYINVQGDEPVVNTQDLKKILNYSKKIITKLYLAKQNAIKRILMIIVKQKLYVIKMVSFYIHQELEYLYQIKVSMFQLKELYGFIPLIENL